MAHFIVNAWIRVNKRNKKMRRVRQRMRPQIVYYVVLTDASIDVDVGKKEFDEY